MPRRERDTTVLVPRTATRSVSADLVPSTAGRALTRDERRIKTEWQKQKLVMEGTAAKVVVAQAEIAKIHKHGIATFQDTASYIGEVKQRARGQEYQDYVDEFAAQEVQSLSRHMLGIIEVGATSIGYEVSRSLYPPPQGFWERLIGGE